MIARDPVIITQVLLPNLTFNRITVYILSLMSERIKTIQATPKNRRASIARVKNRRRNRRLWRAASSIRLANKRPPVHTVRENSKKSIRKGSAKKLMSGEVCVICFSAWENIEHRAPSLDAARKRRNVTLDVHCKVCVLITSSTLLTRSYKNKNKIIKNI